MKWCRQYGISCKDKNCQYEHLEEMPEICDAMLEFEGTSHFGFCELDKGHEGNHRCLIFEWEGEGTTRCHNSYRLRGLNLMKAKMNKTMIKERK